MSGELMEGKLVREQGGAFALRSSLGGPPMHGMGPTTPRSPDRRCSHSLLAACPGDVRDVGGFVFVASHDE